jgi:hypothetical protein
MAIRIRVHQKIGAFVGRQGDARGRERLREEDEEQAALGFGEVEQTVVHRSEAFHRPEEARDELEGVVQGQPEVR